MYRTIEVSSCLLIQGEFVEVLGDGSVVIRDGANEYRGRPIARRGVAPEAMARAADHVVRTL